MSPHNDNAWGEPPTSPPPFPPAPHDPEAERLAAERVRETMEAHTRAAKWIETNSCPEPLQLPRDLVETLGQILGQLLHAASREDPAEPLVHVGWYCWRCHAINAQACRSDCVPVHVPREWESEMRAEIARREEGDEDESPDTAEENMQVRTLTPEIMEEFRRYRDEQQTHHHQGDTP